MATRAQLHGMLSLSLISVATVIAAVVMFQVSWTLGAAYLGACVVALLGIVYTYCAKCSCRAHCGHVMPGRVAMLFKRRTPGPYTKVELGVLGLALLLLLGLPQGWLWQRPTLFVAYWLLTAIALVEIRVVVCRVCDNRYCPARIRC